MAIAVNSESAPDVGPEARELLETYCFLACLGPGFFDPNEAARVIRLDHGPDRATVLERLLDPEQRAACSSEIGHLLATTLAARRSEGGTSLRTLLPALVRADVEAGFTVLRNFAAAASPALAETLADACLSLMLADQAGTAPNGCDPCVRDRLRYLLSVLTRLSLQPESRTRLFLALSQSLQSGEVLRDVVFGSLFPAGSQQGLEVLLRGQDEAVRAVITGAAMRPNGKSEFYATCRCVMDLGLRAGLPVLARVHERLDPRDGAHRALAAMVRAALLLAIEHAIRTERKLKALLPEDPDLATLDLLTIVTPGVPQPHRTEICDYLLGGAGTLLRSLRCPMDDCETVVQVVIGAVVLHADPVRAASEVRRILLDAAGALHVRLQSGDTQAIAPFQKVVRLLAGEFRRRESLASCLAPVIPLVSDFTPRDRAFLESIGEDVATAVA